MSKKFSVLARLASFRFAIQGMRTLMAEEHNARVHLFATSAAILLGIAVGLTKNEWLWIVLAIALVWLAEAFNTAIEQLGNAVSVERVPQIGAAKDVAAAAVLIASLASVIIGLIIFLPYIIDLARA